MKTFWHERPRGREEKAEFHNRSIDDLHAHVRAKFAALASAPGNVHLTPEGCLFLAEKVAASILQALGDKPPTTRPAKHRPTTAPKETP